MLGFIVCFPRDAHAHVGIVIHSFIHDDRHDAGRTARLAVADATADSGAYQMQTPRCHDILNLNFERQ